MLKKHLLFYQFVYEFLRQLHSQEVYLQKPDLVEQVICYIHEYYSLPIKSAPIWGALDAVQKDQIFEIDGWSFWFSDPISILGQIEEVAALLVAHEKEK